MCIIYIYMYVCIYICIYIYIYTYYVITCKSHKRVQYSPFFLDRSQIWLLKSVLVVAVLVPSGSVPQSLSKHYSPKERQCSSMESH